MSAVVEQLPSGFRYRVTQGNILHAASPLYNGLDACIYALQKRFPGLKVDRVVVL